MFIQKASHGQLFIISYKHLLYAQKRDKVSLQRTVHDNQLLDLRDKIF